jgi:putative oxidoreductase
MDSRGWWTRSPASRSNSAFTISRNSRRRSDDAPSAPNQRASGHFSYSRDGWRRVFRRRILKFLHPEELGVGRFAKIGIPSPEVIGPFVGGVEIVCGALVIIGLLTRFAAIPLLSDISVAILTTKIPILLGRGFGGFSLMKLPHYGLLSMIHEARTDLCMWFGLVFLLVVGRAESLD